MKTTTYTFDDSALYRLSRMFTVSSATTATSTGMTTNLVSYWPFDNDATDSHASNDLTAINSPTYTASGKIGYAADSETDSDQYFSITEELWNWGLTPQ